MDWLNTALNACVALLAVLLARAGLSRRIAVLETHMRNEDERVSGYIRQVIEQQQLQFRSELGIALAPMARRLDDQDQVLGQLMSTVASIDAKLASKP